MGLLEKATKGVFWTGVSSLCRNLLALFQISIVARHLDKVDFGTLAIATLFLGFTQIFLDLGISAAIMHKQNTNSSTYSSLFWLNVFMGLFLTIVLVALSPLISLAYNDKNLQNIIIILSFTVFFSSLGSQHRTVQEKNLRFKYVALIDISCSFLTMCIAVTLVLYNFGIYSLVFSSLFQAVFSGLSYLILGLIKDKNIYFHFSFHEVKPYLRIGIFGIGSSFLDYCAREMDVLFISSVFGKEVLGLYVLCKKIVIMVYSFINPILTKVLTPLLAKIQDDKLYLRRSYCALIESIAITNMPLYFLISCFSSTILSILYGDQYISGAPILAVLAIYYCILSLSNPVGSLQIALGKTDVGFYWTIYRIIFSFIMIYIGSLYSLEILVTLLLVSAIVNTVALWKFQINRFIGISLIDYIDKLYKPLLFSLILSIPSWIFFFSNSNLCILIFYAFAFITVYIYSILKFVPNAYIISIFLKRKR